MKLIAEISVAKLEDRKMIAGILYENGYTIGSGKRKKNETGKSIDYYIKIYTEDE